MRRRSALGWLLAALLWAAGPSPVAARISIIPLPEILTDPNEGNTYGLLPVVLLVNDKGRLDHIIAHDIRYNPITGWFPAFRLLGYPTVDLRYYVTLRKSEKIDEDYIGEFERRNLFDGTTDVSVNLTYFRDSRLRFYGFGNGTSDDDETNYTQRRAAATARVGYRPLRNVEVQWQIRIEDVAVHRGGVNDLPFAAEVYPDTPGLGGATIHGERFTIAYDDRDSRVITRNGTLGAAYVEIVDRALGSTTSFVKYGFEVRRFIPFHDRFVLAMHGVLDYLSGGQVPFYERNSIGGKLSLRGFGDERFVDAQRFFSTVELRTRAFDRRVFDVDAELEVAPFVDAGQVFESPASVPFDDLHFVGGLGFRGVVVPQIVGFVDVGYGSDGAAVFTGLDYPF